MSCRFNERERRGIKREIVRERDNVLQNHPREVVESSKFGVMHKKKIYKIVVGGNFN